MSFETDYRSRLKDDGTIASLVSTRIDWGVRPQGAPYPSIVLSVVADSRNQHMAGIAGFQPTRVQVDCYATSFTGAAAIRDAALAVLVPAVVKGATTFLRSFVNDVRGGGNQTDTAFIHRQMIDLTVWHN